ncbi:serine hydrolase [Streptomyces sp. NPDC006270]|uniref:serine hydrolase n=1 Tax=Streptomyces sp. NPDC006270 TaxID=3364741 RepID=UPI0036D17EBB
MAGESPDKTEQQKSSGTAAEERDPRFAVFRAPGADTKTETGEDTNASGSNTDTNAGGSGNTGTGNADTGATGTDDADTGRDGNGGAGTGATSDTATAVFRPRLPADAARRAADVQPPSGTGEPKSEPGPKGESGPGHAPESESEPEPESEPVSEAVTASTGPGAAAAPSGDTGDAEGGTSPDTAAEASGAKASVEGPAGRPEAGPEPEAEPEAGPGPGAEAGDGRLRAAVAAWVDAAAEDEPTARTEGDAVSDAGSETGPKPEAEAKAEPGPEGEPDDEPKPEPTSTAGPKPERMSEPDADDASDLRGIDQPTAIFKAVKPGRTAGSAEPVDQATTALKLPPNADKSRSESQGADTSGSESRSEGRSRDKKQDADRDKKQDRNEGRSPGGSGGSPENEVERTSTFVPLRSDDVRPAPAPRKPEAGTAAQPGEAGSAAHEASAGTPETGSPASTAPAAPSWAAAERTRQQPLPPRPPLDLLAELTNTPPPRETPVRTAVRRVKIWTPLVLLLLIVFAIVQVMRPLPEPSLELTAKPTYTFEGGATKLSWPGQGQSAVMVDGVGSLGSEGAQKPAPIASVAKVMTAYVILQEHPLKGDEEGETITVDQKAEDESKRPDESTAPLTKGQRLSQRQMLQLLMIPSGNNAARLLARWDAGSEDAFLDKMNDAAKKLGMTGSTYTDPSGLKKSTVSTATDQLKLAQAVMRNEVFRKIVDMPQVKIEGIDGMIYNNNNILLQPGVSGIKTGSSTPAGGNLLWSANTKVDGKMLWIYGAVMGQQAGTGRVYDSLELSLQNSLKLIKDAQKAATSATVVKKGDVVGYVDNGFGAQTPVVATKNLKAVGWSGLEVELEVTDNGEGIDHAAKAGSEVGMVTVGTGPGKVTAPVVLQNDLTEAAFGDKLTRIG